MIRIGVIGCGDVANFGHIPAILSVPKFHIAALFDPDGQRLANTAATVGGVPGFQDLDAFYAEGLDAVVIASPAPTHFEHVLEVAKRGVHVLCEKPIADSEADALKMEEAMAKANRIFTIGFCYRFSAVTRQISKWIGEGVIGKVRVVRIVYIWNLHGRFRPDDNGQWSESAYWRGRMLEGGPMVDCGVHAIDLSRLWLESEPTAVYGHGAWVADYEAPDHVWLHMDHHSGAHTMVEMSYSFTHTSREPLSQFTYELIGDGGVIRYNRDGYVLEARTGQETLRVPGASEKNFPGMYEAFASAIESGNGCGLPSAKDGIIATRIAGEATKQAISLRQSSRNPLP